jgi:tRNA1Val (adenine37-N6)-methyltransferase
MFHFKQFSVDQTDCAMKVNTDGVLLGAMADAENPQTILDVGAGTGVIALMLAQRFPDAKIDAVEIDELAAHTCKANFAKSPFQNRLTACAGSFQDFAKNHPDKQYDLIVSNPPFYIHSLKSENKATQIAKHTDEFFFQELIGFVAKSLKIGGTCCLILPEQAKVLVEHLVFFKSLYINKIIFTKSFSNTPSHRNILFFGPEKLDFIEKEFVIYAEQGLYTEAYRDTLKDFLTIF